MGTLSDIFMNRSRIDFPALWRKSLVISGVLVAVAIGALLFRGLNLGIEFEGGASWEVSSSTVTTDELRSAMEPFGLGDARIQRVANDLYRVRAETESTAQLEQIKAALAEAAGTEPNDVTANAVGASWGQEITAKARTALIVFFVVIFIYISVRLEWRMGVAALVAVIHDILISVGFYALFQLEVTSATVIAFLTILGYSLYDTLIVFDKIRENQRRASGVDISYTDVASYSMNQVLMRSINTTITSVLPVAAVLVVGRFILGAVTLQEFALALLVGLLAGSYSSIFVATPVLTMLKERQPSAIDASTSDDYKSNAVDIEAALADADRARKVRSSARGEGHRVTGSSDRRSGVTKRRSSATGSKSGAKSGSGKKSDPKSDSGKKPDIKPRPKRNR